ncbi:hypothetical protein MHY86_09710 [Aerococcus urinaeequi]|uniref:hypothetical protein n=1 Tax=Aerococcus urinaeequi TaxID=51665 RepID=UPI00227FD37D|nr:hypothetical protein [Aerococcus urinaeequi]MCY7731971.1 hypothetical protein [Aerococcus urinaeequi]MED3622459.1 hypothetical protein [Bacillus thuringiensis]
MKAKSKNDIGLIMSSVLNVFFLIGLSFISRTENIYLVMLYISLMIINAIYLIISSGIVLGRRRKKE